MTTDGLGVGVRMREIKDSFRAGMHVHETRMPLIFEWILAFCENFGLSVSVFNKALLRLWWQRLSNQRRVSEYDSP